MLELKPARLGQRPTLVNTQGPIRFIGYMQSPHVLPRQTCKPGALVDFSRAMLYIVRGICCRKVNTSIRSFVKGKEAIHCRFDDVTNRRAVGSFL